jgi:DNA-binding MarR family transcriptional regulator
MKRVKRAVRLGVAGHTGDEPHLLREIIRTHQVLMTGFSREVGVPASRFALLRLLANVFPDAAGVMDIARRLGVNAAAVTRQVQEMESEGLLLRRADARDGRRSGIRLSAKGLKLFSTIHDRSHELERSLASAIAPREMASAADVLTRLRRFLEGLR